MGTGIRRPGRLTWMRPEPPPTTHRSRVGVTAIPAGASKRFPDGTTVWEPLVALDLEPPGGGELRIAGTADVCQPISADVRVVLKDVEMGAYQSYLPTPARVAGRAHADLTLRYASADAGVAVRGQAAVARLDVRDPERTVVRVERATATGLWRLGLRRLAGGLAALAVLGTAQGVPDSRRSLHRRADRGRGEGLPGRPAQRRPHPPRCGVERGHGLSDRRGPLVGGQGARRERGRDGERRREVVNALDVRPGRK
jgi:hypothetical protein